MHSVMDCHGIASMQNCAVDSVRTSVRDWCMLGRGFETRLGDGVKRGRGDGLGMRGLDEGLGDELGMGRDDGPDKNLVPYSLQDLVMDWVRAPVTDSA